MKLRPLPTALAALALSPATAFAAPHWSAPADVIPSAGASLNSAPRAFVSPAGKSLVVAGSGSQALLASGDAANVFAAPVPVANAAAGATLGLASAIGADGTVAVAWSSGGSAHASVVAPGGGVIGTADLPGAGVNALGAAVAADGTVLVAYRTKESANAYTLRLATAAPGSATFSAPVTIDDGSATDSINIATGPGGAVAIAYRKLTGKYRARVAVRPAGAGAFEAGQALTQLGDEADYSPHVAFDASGTIVAAWGNAAGAQYALRSPGAAGFGAGVALGSGSAYSVDLEPTPTGTTAVSLVGSGAVRAALQAAPGAGFGAPTQVLPTYTSQLTGEAAVTTSPSGTVTVVTANPVDGTVHAVDAGGADTVIGYGAKDGVTPVAIASSADRTVAAWTSATGAVVAATRSESAKPAAPGELGPRPAARDAKPPVLRFVGGSKRVRVTAATKRFSFKVRCDEACKYLVMGSMRTVGKGGKKRIAPLPAAQTKRARTGIQTVTIKLGGLAQKDLRTAVRAGRGAQVFLSIEASDTASNTARTRLQLTLKPAIKHRHR
jgi:hypothetical protein